MGKVEKESHFEGRVVCCIAGFVVSFLLGSYESDKGKGETFCRGVLPVLSQSLSERERRTCIAVFVVSRD